MSRDHFITKQTMDGLAMGLDCPECGRFVGRLRGNLRKTESWQNSIRHLLGRHRDRAHATLPRAARSTEEAT